VRDSDGTVIFSLSPDLSGRSALTKTFAADWNRPCLSLPPEAGEAVNRLGDPGERLVAFIDEFFINTLNIAGPGASSERLIDRFAYETLNRAFLFRN